VGGFAQDLTHRLIARLREGVSLRGVSDR